MHFFFSSGDIFISNAAIIIDSRINLFGTINFENNLYLRQFKIWKKKNPDNSKCNFISLLLIKIEILENILLKFMSG